MRSTFIYLSVFCASTTLFADEYKPELFKSVKLVYEDDFSGGTINSDHWQTRQGSTWVVKDGILVGSPSPKEFQDKKVAEGDKAHAGFKPVMWLERVPENFVVQFRVRFDAEKYHPKFPLIDLGHHINTVNFTADATTLTLKKDKKSIKLDQQFLALNEWADVTIELKQGAMLLKINDKKHLFEDDLIDMVDQQQIDFKGVDHGEIRIDDLKVYEGIN